MTVRINGLLTCRATAATGAVIALLAASMSSAPCAVADFAADLRSAVTQMRGSSCDGLRSDPIVEQAALNVNQSTDQWIDFTARTVPVPDAVPLLKDLGYGGNKATMLFGAGPTDALAIKGLLLQGYKDIPNCSYTDFGASMMKNETNDRYIAAVVLAGA